MLGARYEVMRVEPRTIAEMMAPTNPMNDDTTPKETTV